LSYSYMITAVRSSLRDLVETILVSMFLTHDAERDRNDYHELATRSVEQQSTKCYRTLTITSLPFINDNGCGLAIATRTYLDAINKDGVQPTDKLKGQIKAQEEPYTWFQFVPNLSKNLDNAFKLWDAVGLYSSLSCEPTNISKVVAGTQAAGKEFKDSKTFSDTNEWLYSRR
jgi:Temperature dependent protein affecting M2 dsRNA replication